MSLQNVYLTVTRYLDFYKGYLKDFWNHLSPHEYGLLLISIAVVGWFFLKSGNKR